MELKILAPQATTNYIKNPSARFDTSGWAGAVEPPPSILPFSATFTADNNTLIQNYSPESGQAMRQLPYGDDSRNMVIFDNVACNTLTKGAGAGDDYGENVKMTADLTVPTIQGADVFFMLRYVGANDNIRAGVYSGLLSGSKPVFRIVYTATAAVLATFTLNDVARGDTLTGVVCELSGNDITLTWGAISITTNTATNSGVVTHGIGVFNNTAAERGFIDNLVIEG